MCGIECQHEGIGKEQRGDIGNSCGEDVSLVCVCDMGLS